MVEQVTERKRFPSPAKSTIVTLRQEGFITDDNAVILCKINPTGNDETDYANVPLDRFIGIRPGLINAKGIDVNKLKTELSKLSKEELLALVAELG